MVLREQIKWSSAIRHSLPNVRYGLAVSILACVLYIVFFLIY